MEPSAQRGCRILVVEDDVEVGAMVADQLRGVGYDVLWETSGEGGLRALQEATTQPDVILLDLLLPGISGEAVYAGVDAHPEWRAIPVIVMSGLSAGAARASTRAGSTSKSRSNRRSCSPSSPSIVVKANPLPWQADGPRSTAGHLHVPVAGSESNTGYVLLGCGALMLASVLQMSGPVLTIAIIGAGYYLLKQRYYDRRTIR